jgi:hypothetical protein
MGQSGNAMLAQQMMNGTQKMRDKRNVGTAAIQNLEGQHGNTAGKQAHVVRITGSELDRTISQNPISA